MMIGECDFNGSSKKFSLVEDHGQLLMKIDDGEQIFHVNSREDFFGVPVKHIVIDLVRKRFFQPHDKITINKFLGLL